MGESGAPVYDWQVVGSKGPLAVLANAAMALLDSQTSDAATIALEVRADVAHASTTALAGSVESLEASRDLNLDRTAVPSAPPANPPGAPARTHVERRVTRSLSRNLSNRFGALGTETARPSTPTGTITADWSGQRRELHAATGSVGWVDARRSPRSQSSVRPNTPSTPPNQLSPTQLSRPLLTSTPIHEAALMDEESIVYE